MHYTTIQMKEYIYILRERERGPGVYWDLGMREQMKLSA